MSSFAATSRGVKCVPGSSSLSNGSLCGFLSLHNGPVRIQTNAFTFYVLFISQNKFVKLLRSCALIMVWSRLQYPLFLANSRSQYCTSLCWIRWPRRKSSKKFLLSTCSISSDLSIRQYLSIILLNQNENTLSGSAIVRTLALVKLRCTLSKVTQLSRLIPMSV